MSQDFGAGNGEESGLASYQTQLSLGLHILVMMGTFFAAGFCGVSYLSDNPLHVGASIDPAHSNLGSCWWACQGTFEAQCCSSKRIDKAVLMIW